MTDAGELIRWADRLASDRATFDPHFEQVRELFHPAALPFGRSVSPGAKLHGEIFDSTPEQAAALLAAGLQHLLTNAASRWCALRAEDDALNDDEEAARWLDVATQRMMYVFASPRARFQPQQHEKLLELVSFGTGILHTAEVPGALPLFSARALAECYLAEDGEGRVDTLFRRFTLTARRCVEQWGDKAGPKTVRLANDEKTRDTPVQLLHATYKRAKPGKGRQGLPFASCYVNLEEKLEIDESGYHEFPYACPRWAKKPGESYGRGPGMTALADARMLQRMMRALIRGTEKIIDPTLMVADDGVLSPVSVNPNNLITVRGDTMLGAGSPIRPLITGARPDIAEEIIASVRKRIEAAFLMPLLQFARDPEMTATQVLQITEQTTRILNPILGRLQVEDLDPTVDRTFGILWRAGAFPPPPPQLSGAALKVEYISPIARQQGVGEARAVAEAIAATAPILTLDPAVGDNTDWDAAYRRMWDVLGVPKVLMASTGDVAKARQARQAQARQAAEQAALAQTAKTAATAIGALPALRQAAGQGGNV
jgi:Bacteriophage head to tail connecting protein